MIHVLAKQLALATPCRVPGKQLKYKKVGAIDRVTPVRWIKSESIAEREALSDRSSHSWLLSPRWYHSMQRHFVNRLFQFRFFWHCCYCCLASMAAGSTHCVSIQCWWWPEFEFCSCHSNYYDICLNLVCAIPCMLWLLVPRQNGERKIIINYNKQ